MTASEAFKQLQTDLTPRYGAGEAGSIASIVLEDAFGTKRPDTSITFNDDQIRQFEAIHTRLLAGEPLQYVLGVADFFGLKFTVTPAVLIPRSETEELVAWVLEWLKAHPAASTILDIGIGSGCIGISIKNKRRNLTLLGIEKSTDALAIAQANAVRILGADPAQFIAGDALDPAVWAQFSEIDIIVSNPPYIPYRETDLMPAHVLDHEPAMALFVPDNDPLLFYRVIAQQALHCLRPGSALFFECNEFNASEVADLLRTTGYQAVTLRRDLMGAERMVMGII